MARAAVRESAAVIFTVAPSPGRVPFTKYRLGLYCGSDGLESTGASRRVARPA